MRRENPPFFYKYLKSINRMITFNEFIERVELSESSGGERGRRRVSPRGPSSDRFERTRQRNVSSSNAALKKAGFKRSTKYMTGAKGRPIKWTETSTSSHHDTETGTHANQSDYASRSVPKNGATPTSTRVSKLKRIRTQLGGDRTSRPVHDVAVNKKRTYNDTPSGTMTRGRSFKKEVTKGVPDNLKKAGAKTGDIVSSTPTSGSRSRMYGRTHNTRTDSRTGKTINRFREAFDILEVNRPESGSDVEKARWDRAKARQDALEDPASMFVGTTGRDKGGNRKYGLKSSERKKEQGKRRSANLRPLSHDELKDHAKRNLYPTPQKTANKALKIERERKRSQRDDATTKTQQTGQQHDVDHIQGQPNRRSEGLRSRFQKIHPGDASDNRQVMHGDDNRTKNSKNTQRSTTRAGAIRAALQRAINN
jgi:hypothetical protein